MRVQYQLVVQFVALNIADFDRLIAFEEELIRAIGDSAEVDGHDFGSEQFNIFVHTDEPAAVFAKVQELARSRLSQYSIHAAYRRFGEEGFTVLWPSDLKSFAII